MSIRACCAKSRAAPFSTTSARWAFPIKFSGSRDRSRPKNAKSCARHCEIGFAVLERIPFLKEAAEIVLTHQECYDGSGYPRGLKGEQIPLGARIFAVADTLDAMISDRPYRKALPISAARDEIERYAGTQFDPQVVEGISRPARPYLAGAARKSRRSLPLGAIGARLALLAGPSQRRFAISVKPGS